MQTYHPEGVQNIGRLLAMVQSAAAPVSFPRMQTCHPTALPGKLGEAEAEAERCALCR